MKVEEIEAGAFQYHSKMVQYDPSAFLEWFNPNKEEFLLKVRVTKNINLKDGIFQFLLHLNEDFDDDLLQDSMELLGFE